MTDVFTTGDILPITFLVADENGNPSNATTAEVSISGPTGFQGPLVLNNPTIGTYVLDHPADTAGRYVVIATFTGAYSGTAVKVFDVIDPDLSLVTVSACQEYLGATSWTTGEIASALEAEKAAQAAVCMVDNYGPDLREALLRRVSVNLAARAVPIVEYSSFEGGSSKRVTSSDPVVSRLEAPYRRMVIM